MIYFIAALVAFNVLLTLYALKSISLVWNELSRIREHMGHHNARDHKGWAANAAAHAHTHARLRDAARAEREDAGEISE